MTVTAHGWWTGDRALLNGISGIIELSGRSVGITALSNDTFSTGIDTSAYDAWTSGGAAARQHGITAGDAICRGRPAAAEARAERAHHDAHHPSPARRTGPRAAITPRWSRRGWT